MGKKLISGVVLTLIVMIVIAGCGSNNSPGTTYTPGQPATYTVGSGASAVSFDMHYAPSATSFPTGIDDSGRISVSAAFWMAKTEVTYELWDKVKTWATGYTFVTGHGYKGNVDSGSNQQPVTHVSWQEAIIWCNALTEYCYGNSTNCVYYADVNYTTPIRSVSDSRIDNPYIKAATSGNTDMTNCIAKGFRLPTSNEWELAARYKNGSTWTPGNYASGAAADVSDAAATGAVAWYTSNSGGNTNIVADTIKTANTLGLFDMSGNVFEWCFELYPSTTQRIFRGGDYSNNASYLRIGLISHVNPDTAGSNLGFRFVMTQ